MTYEWSKEQYVTLMLSKLTLAKEEIENVRHILADPTVSTIQIIDYLVKHKTINIFMSNLKKYELNLNHPKWELVLQGYWKSNKIKNEKMYEEVLPLINKLQNLGITCIPIKGIFLNERVYEDNSLRISNDFDLLIKEEDIAAVTNLLLQNGYEQAGSKQLKTFHRMYTHELVPFKKETGDIFCPTVTLDIQFDIFGRSKNTRVYYPMAKLFDSCYEIEVLNGKHKIKTLTLEYHLLQLASHMFRDMTRIQNIVNSSDHRLIHFIDIYEFIIKNKTAIKWDELAEELLIYKANHLFYYVIYHIELLYGTIVPAEFMSKISPSEQNYLNQFGFEESEPFRWEMPFFARLFDDSRKEELKTIDSSLLTESAKYLAISSSL